MSYIVEYFYIYRIIYFMVTYQPLEDHIKKQCSIVY
jgi:hypothetical protein